MSEKRRDDKNRLLRTGESQRKNGTYEFKYTDANGKRHSVYSHDLPELREKEKQIQRALDVIPNDTLKRIALTPQQQRSFLSFIKNDDHFCQYYDEIIVLLGTGMRISKIKEKMRNAHNM